MPSSFSLFLGVSVKLLRVFIAVLSNNRNLDPSTRNLENLIVLLLAHRVTVSEHLQTIHQRVIHGILSRSLANANLRLKFLAIAGLSHFAQSEHHGTVTDNPQSLFEGVKGAKVLRLSLSTVLSAVTPGDSQEFEVIRLCSTALYGIHSSVFLTCTAEPTFHHHISKLRTKAEGHIEPEILPFVTFFLFGSLTESISSFSIFFIQKSHILSLVW